MHFSITRIIYFNLFYRLIFISSIFETDETQACQAFQKNEFFKLIIILNSKVIKRVTKNIISMSHPLIFFIKSNCKNNFEK